MPIGLSHWTEDIDDFAVGSGSARVRNVRRDQCQPPGTQHVRLSIERELKLPLDDHRELLVGMRVLRNRCPGLRRPIDDRHIFGVHKRTEKARHLLGSIKSVYGKEWHGCERTMGEKAD